MKERKKESITRQDLAEHFAGYNRYVANSEEIDFLTPCSISMGKAASLHARWVRCRPEGAMSKQCQELNALYSQCVDGAMIRIPDHLRTPPEPSEPFIVDVMLEEAKIFAQQWLANNASLTTKVEQNSDEQSIIALLSSERLSMSEFQALQLAGKIARRSSIDLRQYYPLMNFSALGVAEKHLVCSMFEMNNSEMRMVWNRYVDYPNGLASTDHFASLMRSDLLSPSVFQRDLHDPPLRLQRLYTTAQQGLSGFFEYLRRSLEQFRRRLIIIKTGDRFSAGIFIRGPIQWDEEAVVNDNVVVFSLTPTAQNEMSLCKRSKHLGIIVAF